MCAKEYLMQATKLSNKINADLLELENLRDMIESVSAVDYTKNRVTGGGENAVESGVIKLADISKKINQEIDDYADTKELIRSQIADLPDEKQRILLQHRYLTGMTWDEIAEEMGYEKRNIQYIHRRALDAFKTLHSFALDGVVK